MANLILRVQRRMTMACRLAVCFFALGFSTLPSDAHADELRRLFLLILDDPASIALNSKYAKIAEDKGERSRALLAWERILANHPDNIEAKRNVEKLQAILKPSNTNYLVSLSGKYDTNAPLQDSTYDTYDDVSMSTLLFARDERSVGSWRLGTDATIYGNFYNRYTEGDAALFALSSGPFLDVTPSLRLRVAPEISVVRLNRHSLYTAGALLVEAEAGESSLPFKSAKLKTGYENYTNENYDSKAHYLTASATYGYSDLLFGGDQFNVTPKLHFQKSKLREYRYTSLGATLSYAYSLTERVTLEPELGLEASRYAGFAAEEDSRRWDQTVTPSVTTTLNDFLTDGVSLSGTYEFSRNFSNDGENAYKNHQIGATLSWLY